MAGLNEDPEVVFHFILEFDDGGAPARFSEVSGIEAETEVITYRAGASVEYSPIKVPGLTTFSNITLKRGIAVNNALWDWYAKTVARRVERWDITIKLLNEDHEPVVTWKLSKAWPCKYTGPSLSSASNEIAIESLELAHERLDVQVD